MKSARKKVISLTICAILCFSVFSACSTSENDSHEGGITPNSSSDTMNSTFRASDIAIPAQEKYEFPFMGLRMVLPQPLLQKMSAQEIAMLPDERLTEDGQAIAYAFVSWNAMTEEQKNMSIEKSGEAYFRWVSSLERVGTLGIYRSEMRQHLDELTRCAQHIELGKSADGTYHYYLSINPQSHSEWTAFLKQIHTEITEMIPFQQTSAFAMPNHGTQVGPFQTTDVHGKEYTEKFFQQAELTMVNVFATWCSPCVQEIPDLERLHQEMKTQGIQVVGIVMDTIDYKGKNQQAIEKAKLLAQRAGVTYPFLIPDSTFFHGRLEGIEAIPETFFVDKNGNIVGKTYSGSRTFAMWKEIVEEELQALKVGKS